MCHLSPKLIVARFFVAYKVCSQVHSRLNSVNSSAVSINDLVGETCGKNSKISIRIHTRPIHSAKEEQQLALFFAHFNYPEVSYQ